MAFPSRGSLLLHAMTAETNSFELPPGVDPERVLADIVGADRLFLERPRPTDDLYLDTRDGRLLGQGATLCMALSEGRGTSIRLDHEGTVLRGALADGAPRFAWELRQDALRRALDALVANRELRSILRLRGERRRFRIVGPPDAACAAGWIERTTAVVPGDEAVELPPRIVVQVEGGAAAVGIGAGIAAGLATVPGARRADARLARALESTGIVPGSARAPSVAIQTGMPALFALRIVHRGLLDRIMECRALVREGDDPEALHDLRVAVRRTRAALGQLREVYPEQDRARFRSELGWLARTSGAARDLDVFISWLRRYQWESPGRVAEALQPLMRHLQRARREEQVGMVEQLTSPRCEQLLAGWARFLGTVDRASSGPRADRPIDELVRDRFERALAKTHRLASELGPRPDAAAVHRLRLAAKRARYLIDLFEPLHHPERIERLSPAFRALQDALGDHHDAALQEQRVLAFSASLAGERGNAPTVLALGRLVGELGRRQSAILRALPDLIAALDEVREEPTIG